MGHTSMCVGNEASSKSMGPDHYHYDVKSSVFPMACDCPCHGSTRRVV